MKAGSKLKNGATVVAFEDDGHHGVVLAVKDDGEYVTWEYGVAEEDTYWGHYFWSSEEAFADYAERSKKVK